MLADRFYASVTCPLVRTRTMAEEVNEEQDAALEESSQHTGTDVSRILAPERHSSPTVISEHHTLEHQRREATAARKERLLQLTRASLTDSLERCQDAAFEESSQYTGIDVSTILAPERHSS